MPDPTPPAEPPFSPTIALLAVARMWDADFAEALKGLGLTTRKYGLLGHIRSSPGISFSDLARRSRITVQTAHVAVRSLVDDGLVDDATAQAGASSVLRLTEAGERALAAAGERLTELDARFADAHPGLSAALREELRRMMSARAGAQPA